MKLWSLVVRNRWRRLNKKQIFFSKKVFRFVLFMIILFSLLSGFILVTSLQSLADPGYTGPDKIHLSEWNNFTQTAFFIAEKPISITLNSSSEVSLYFQDSFLGNFSTYSFALNESDIYYLIFISSETTSITFSYESTSKDTDFFSVILFSFLCFLMMSLTFLLSFFYPRNLD